MITVDINDAEVDAAFARIQKHLTDMTPVFEVLGDLLEDSTEKRFDEGVSPEGVPWAPKSQTTIDTYTRKGFWSSNSIFMLGSRQETLKSF